jgi:aspartate-semialdehyde dehydrogenase
MSQKNRNDENSAEETKAQPEVPRINWDQTKMTTTYANVCNVSSTREEVSVLFGTNQTVNVAQNGITVELTDRIILNPYAAKRLAHILTGVLQQYETAFGALPID